MPPAVNFLVQTLNYTGDYAAVLNVRLHSAKAISYTCMQAIEQGMPQVLSCFRQFLCSA